jgi:hypothetical protein
VPVLTVADFEETEQRMRSLLSEAGLPPPDRVEYWEITVAFFWEEPKACVAVELTDHPNYDGPEPPT